MRYALFFLFSSFLGYLQTSAGEPGDLPGAAEGEIPLPHTICYRTDCKIVVDGDLSEASWEKAPAVGEFYTWDGQPASGSVDCRILWDDEALYFGFRVPDRNIVAVHTNRDEYLWLHDVVEIFLDPQATLHMYVEIIVNPLNTIFDAYQITNETRDSAVINFWDWDAKRMTTAVRVMGNVKGPEIEPIEPDVEWSVEMRVPFNTFVAAINNPPRPGDVWRAAITRYDGRDAVDPEYRHYAWSPPYRLGNPHVLRRLGFLEFSGETVGAF